jgi:phage shock protein A
MIFKRIRDIVLSGVHETLDKLEDPVALVKQYLRDVEVEIGKAQHTIANQVVLEKRHAALIADTQAQIAKRARQAKLAVDTEDEEIAKLALRDKVLLESKLAVYEEQYATITTHTETLTAQLQDLQEKYSDMQAKKRVLFARAQAAKAQCSLNTTLSTIDADSAVRGFARMEERVLQLEAHVEASHRVLATHRQLERLTPDTTVADKVDEELAKLKAAKGNA